MKMKQKYKRFKFIEKFKGIKIYYDKRYGFYFGSKFANKDLFLLKRIIINKNNYKRDF